VTRRKSPLSVVICDVDHFKAYNDRYGHPAGDQCLKQIAAVLAHNCKRATDLYARYGGEEFALILPETPAEGALRVAEAIRSELVTLGIVHEASPTSQVVTLSAGIAAYAAGRDRDAHSLVVRADQALYRAKELGRNRVICS
jgi:diguanylate cyclase (GGDEF)-like protein